MLFIFILVFKEFLIRLLEEKRNGVFYFFKIGDIKKVSRYFILDFVVDVE